MATSKASCNSLRRCFRISAKRTRIGRLMPRRTSVSISCFRSMERCGSFSGCTSSCPPSPTEKYPLPPAGDVIQFACVLRGPSVGGLQNERAFTAVLFHWSKFQCPMYGRRSVLIRRNRRYLTERRKQIATLGSPTAMIWALSTGTYFFATVCTSAAVTAMAFCEYVSQ